MTVWHPGDVLGETPYVNESYHADRMVFALRALAHEVISVDNCEIDPDVVELVVKALALHDARRGEP